jgi:hypothetical protein
MPERSWKRSERAIAARIGGRRVPVTGRQRGDVPDVAHHLFAVEVKHRRRPLRLLDFGMLQAIAAARGSQIPVLVLHTTGRRHADDYVVMRLGDWCDLNGSIAADTCASEGAE